MPSGRRRRKASSVPLVDLALDLLILDGRHLLWRAAHAYQGLSVPDDASGTERETGAIYGWLRIALGAWQRFGGIVVVAWDTPEGPVHRRKLYPAYKERATGEVDRNLITSMRAQEDELRALLKLMGLRQAFSTGWEADDAIAALCRRFATWRIGILSGDRDLLQLVTETVSLLRPAPKGTFKIETPATIRDEWGIKAAQILDLKALAGDPSDNIPGAPGIGPKTATKLVQEHGSWRRALDWAAANPPERAWHRALIEHADRVRMSALLAELHPEVPLAIVYSRPDGKAVFNRMVALRFSSLLSEGRREALMAMAGPMG